MEVTVYQLLGLADSIWTFQFSARGCFHEDFTSCRWVGKGHIADKAVCEFKLQISPVVGPRTAPPPEFQPRETYIPTIGQG